MGSIAGGGSGSAGFDAFLVGRGLGIVLLVVGCWCLLAWVVAGSSLGLLVGGEGVSFGAGGGGCLLFLSTGDMIAALGVGNASGAVDDDDARARRSCSDSDSRLGRGGGIAKSLPTISINAWM